MQEDIGHLYKIVYLTPNDWQKAKSIRLEALQNAPQAFGSSYAKEAAFPIEKWQSRLIPYSNELKSWSVYAEDEEGNIVGMVGAYVPEDNVPNIVSMYVSPKARGRGVGSMLVDEVIKQIRLHKEFNVAKLIVNQVQTDAVGLYKKFSFKVVEECKEKMGDGQEYSAFIMERNI